ncbi:MAG: Wzz/FepE/Etk N-terminal domain-containing protein [Bryobacteraceae bacterium]
MLEEHESDLSLVKLLVHHWRIALITICVCVGIAGMITLLMPRRYESAMKFLVNDERADLVLTPEKNPTLITRSEVTETEVNSEIELLKSQDLLDSVVTDNHLDEEYKNQARQHSQRLAIERAAIKLQKNLSISAIHRTNVVEVKYKSGDPDLAVSILRDLGDRYLNAHLAAHSAPGSFAFFTEQVDKYDKQLSQARLALDTFHRSTQFFSMPQQQSGVVDQLQSVDAQLKEADAQLAEQQSRLDESQRQLSLTPERVITQVRSVPNQYSTEQMQSMLTSLKNKRIELAMKFKPGDRLLTEIDEEIANTEQELVAAQRGRATEQTTDLGVIYGSLKADYVKGLVTIKGLKARRAELTASRQAYLGQLAQIEDASVTLQTLEQTEKEAQDNYQLYSHRLQEARLADSLDREKFSNVVMIEKPMLSPIPISPKLTLNLAVGAVVGILMALIAAYLFDTRRPQKLSTVTHRPERVYADGAFSASAAGD